MQVKCHQYWPQVGSVSYGNFTVTLIDSMEVANYCVRTLRLAKVCCSCMCVLSCVCYTYAYAVPDIKVGHQTSFNHCSYLPDQNLICLDKMS